MVDRRLEALEERHQRVVVGGVERLRADRLGPGGGLGEPTGVPPGEDDVAAGGAHRLGGGQPDARAAADDHGGLAGELLATKAGSESGFDGHDSSSGRLRFGGMQP